MKYPILLLIIMLLSHGHSSAEEINISNFSGAGLAGWETKTFKGQTEYSLLLNENNTTVIKAHSKGTASGLFKKVQLDPRRFRYLRWSWKIAGTVVGGDELNKSGDDYAARVYLVFPGRFFWQTRAINYIWANRLPIGQSVPNAFTGNAMMVAVAKAGQWNQEQRDILADYRLLFGEEPGDIGAIAIMTDCDNTGSEATTWYGEISISTGK